MSDLATALGLVLVIEGLLWGGFPNAASRMAADLGQRPPVQLRLAGIAAMALGVVIVWAARG